LCAGHKGRLYNLRRPTSGEAFPDADEGKVFVLAFYRNFRFILTFAAVLAAPAGARAQGKLEAHYTVTLAGIPIGKGTWVIDITDTHYTAAASGVTTGLVRVFTGGQGTSAANGALVTGQPVSAIYTSTITTSKKSDAVKLTISHGVVKESKIEPPADTDPERVPITDEHRKGILDPMTASLLRTPGNGDPLSQEACNNRIIAIFDGRLRYDLQLAFKRMDRVAADKGYAGPAVVCAVYFSPIAGYIPSRSAIRYVTKLRDIEVWLAPIAGTRVLVPFRAQGPTPLGRVVMEATQFVSTQIPARASANGVKTQ
jgi:hypothetical protein